MNFRENGEGLRDIQKGRAHGRGVQSHLSLGTHLHLTLRSLPLPQRTLRRPFAFPLPHLNLTSTLSQACHSCLTYFSSQPEEFVARLEFFKLTLESAKQKSQQMEQIAQGLSQIEGQGLSGLHLAQRVYADSLNYAILMYILLHCSFALLSLSFLPSLSYLLNSIYIHLWVRKSECAKALSKLSVLSLEFVRTFDPLLTAPFFLPLLLSSPVSLPSPYPLMAGCFFLIEHSHVS